LGLLVRSCKVTWKSFLKASKSKQKVRILTEEICLRTNLRICESSVVGTSSVTVLQGDMEDFPKGFKHLGTIVVLLV